MNIQQQPMWTAFKHPAPHRRAKWAVKTHRGVFSFATKRLTELFIKIAAPAAEKKVR